MRETAIQRLVTNEPLRMRERSESSGSEELQERAILKCLQMVFQYAPAYNRRLLEEIQGLPDSERLDRVIRAVLDVVPEQPARIRAGVESGQSARMTQQAAPETGLAPGSRAWFDELKRQTGMLEQSTARLEATLARYK